MNRNRDYSNLEDLDKILSANDECFVILEMVPDFSSNYVCDVWGVNYLYFEIHDMQPYIDSYYVRDWGYADDTEEHRKFVSVVESLEDYKDFKNVGKKLHLNVSNIVVIHKDNENRCFYISNSRIDRLDSNFLDTHMDADEYVEQNTFSWL